MTSPTRERSPLRVWRGMFREWFWSCAACPDCSDEYDSWRAALADGLDHLRTCAALRLARLEAELEKAAADLATMAEAKQLFGKAEGYQAFTDAADWIIDILARHRQASA